jgi:hypothetical protein
VQNVGWGQENIPLGEVLRRGQNCAVET